MAGKLELRGWDFRPCGYENLAWNPDDAFRWADPRTGRQSRGRNFRYILTDNRKIAVSHFQNLRAIAARLTLVGPISAKSFQKHVTTCYFSSILSNFSLCKDASVVAEQQRNAICSEIARLLKEERLRKRLSLNVLSSIAGLNRQTVSFIEQEKRTPTIDTLLRISDVLEIRLEDLIRKARKSALARE